MLSGIAALALGGAPDALAAGGGPISAATGTSSARSIAPHHARRRPGASAASGGAGIVPGPQASGTPSHPIVAGTVAKIIRGVAYAPAQAPLQVQRAIWAGDRIRRMPYLWGGGHGSFNSPGGYDCWGATSYVLHAAGLLGTPDDSSGFMSWGASGRGQWITVYTNPSHAFIQIAGIRFDTSSEGGGAATPSGSGPRWRPLLRDTGGFESRHASSF